MSQSTGRSSIGQRIFDERKRLGLSQSAFALAAGVSLSTQKRYEKSERNPDAAYLESIRRLGVDVNRVLFDISPGQVVDCPFSARMGTGGEGRIVKPITIDECRDMATGVKMRQLWKGEGIGGPLGPWYEYCQACALHPAKTGAQVTHRPESIDVALLTAILEGIDAALSGLEASVPPTKRAQAAAMLYRSFKASGKVDPAMIEEAVKLAAG
ncbi:helix-turn-helix domain-containing protein [Rhodocyclus purpureus]|uniref:helix-turn-helix domain-containing protein n=1 Tax=Rhodocyclus purpureus TaxID=1067 RepID=UPI001914557D|nr:helix-turn-helix transcriptional regulator [Rhodocyclus purpureus]MBK5915350.1 hypothetical protein [Rhodocyclus purpureus]